MISVIVKSIKHANNRGPVKQISRSAITTARGTLLSKPERTSFGIVKVILSVVPGLFVGAMISTYMANFLEENEIFNPSEDDNDDDD